MHTIFIVLFKPILKDKDRIPNGCRVMFDTTTPQSSVVWMAAEWSGKRV